MKYFMTLQLCLNRHGVNILATTLECARGYVQGRMTARMMRREQGLSVLDAGTIPQERRDVLLYAESDLEASLNVDGLDAAIDT